MITIIGIKLDNRIDKAIEFQKFLTEHGCHIRTRLGIHPMGDYKCNNYGVILIEVVSNFNEIYDTLAKNHEVQVMKF